MLQITFKGWNLLGLLVCLNPASTFVYALFIVCKSFDNCLFKITSVQEQLAIIGIGCCQSFSIKN